MAKKLILGLIQGHQSIFSLSLALPVTRYGQLSSCKIPQKINDPILRNFSDRQDIQTDQRE